MTNFELMMLKIAQEIQSDKDAGLVAEICCTLSGIPCSRCPARLQCEKWTNNNDKFEEWLRQEAENE